MKRISGRAWGGIGNAAAILLLCSGCASFLPDSGPSAGQISDVQQNSKAADIQVIDVTPQLTQELLASQHQELFSDVFGESYAPTDVVNAGDSLQLSIWEAPPATLFGPSSGAQGEAAGAGESSTAQALDLPEQVISSDGTVEVPFVGRLVVAGKTPREIEEMVVRSLKGKAHEPQVLVRIAHNATADVTVVGEVTSSTRMPLTPKRERLLDALAAANGSKQPSDKLSVRLTRGKIVDDLPLETIIRDPRQDVELKPGDIVSVLYQPYSFTVLGATIRNDEVYFEAKGISLSQALGRANGINDSRANAKGVFVFRFVPEAALNWSSPHFITPDGRVPVIYRIDLTEPSSFFALQNFSIKDKDIVYIANAPSVEIQKFIDLIAPITAPFLNGAANGAGV
jgi:polysaccharide biosynthesis/export protein